ncbi:MAG: diguanylate cyclase [Actinomycetota bacterium]|nr:diguanylate cyclase [Actinomycetota bacterium]
MDDASATLDALCASNLFDTPDGIFFFKDLDGRFIRVSKACAALVGRTPEEMVGLTDADLTDAAHAAALRDDEVRIATTGEPMIDKQEVDRLADRPGTWVETSKFPLRAPEGTVIGTFGYSRDVTRWERAEQALVRVEAQLRAVLNASQDAIGHYDRDLRCLYANPAAERFKSRRLAELIGRTDRETGMAEEWLAFYEPALRRVLETGTPEELEFAGDPDRAGRGSWFHVTLTPDRDTAGSVIGVLSSMRDMTEVKKAQRAIKRQALHDPLTGLANRILLMDRLEAALVALERHPAEVALFFVDVDHFKAVNDRHGHEVGDRVLIEVARRLELTARAEDTVARHGGDEYVVLCSPMTVAEARQLADRIVASMAEPVRVGAEAIAVTVSVGAMATADPKVTADALLSGADAAMYRAKIAGRNRCDVVPDK